jgi:hypothetical protein
MPAISGRAALRKRQSGLRFLLPWHHFPEALHGCAVYALLGLLVSRLFKADRLLQHLNCATHGPVIIQCGCEGPG